MALHQTQLAKKPPSNQSGIILWLKINLFSSTLNSVLTLFTLYILYLTIPPLLNWMVFDATFNPTITNDNCSKDGACWPFVFQNFNLFIYGFYPEDGYWRIHTAFLLIVLFVFIVKMIKNYRYKYQIIGTFFFIYPIIAFFLLYGGLGLEVIETHRWGGLTLTVVVASVGIFVSFPLGILLALGRQSKMQVIRLFSVIYIEFIRGIPLITILFMASVVLPLFFASSMDMDKLIRALIGITLFQTAYIAEVVRGGLQAIPRGQYEAASSLGLNFMQKTVLIILPQALKVSIPNIVGSFIALFKDTTLVLIIGLFDILAMVHLSTSNNAWLGRETEGYVFVTIVMWIILYSMSRYSRTLEHKFNTNHK